MLNKALNPSYLIKINFHLRFNYFIAFRDLELFHSRFHSTSCYCYVNISLKYFFTFFLSFSCFNAARFKFLLWLANTSIVVQWKKLKLYANVVKKSQRSVNGDNSSKLIKLHDNFQLLVTIIVIMPFLHLLKSHFTKGRCLVFFFFNCTRCFFALGLI